MWCLMLSAQWLSSHPLFVLLAARVCIHKLREREDWTWNFRTVILRPISAMFTTMTVVHFPGTYDPFQPISKMFMVLSSVQ
jgi:hypothetical protein